jgi:hypothetical protein
MLVETNKHDQYFVVYKLLKLVLILPVATANVERVLSSMNHVKNKPRNKMSDNYLKIFLVTFFEREFFRRYHQSLPTRQSQRYIVISSILHSRVKRYCLMQFYSCSIDNYYGFVVLSIVMLLH